MIVPLLSLLVYPPHCKKKYKIVSHVVKPSKKPTIREKCSVEIQKLALFPGIVV